MFNFKAEVVLDVSTETKVHGVVHVNVVKVTWLEVDGYKIKLDGGLYTAPSSQEYAYAIPLSMDISEDGSIKTFSLNTGFTEFHVDNFEKEFEEVMKVQYAEEIGEMERKIMAKAKKIIEADGKSQEEAEIIVEEYSIELMAEIMGASIEVTTKLFYDNKNKV